MSDLDPLAARFYSFADEARTYAGPLYEALSRGIAGDRDLLAIARHVRRPPVPNVFLASVHFLLAAAPGHPLARFYGSLTEDASPPDAAFPDFRDFVLSNRARLVSLLETRITQTNEVRRCSFLLPALAAVHAARQSPLSLVDIGCSAGLHLLWDEYFYDYGVVCAGDPASSVRIACELRGLRVPTLPERFPPCTFRVGIDLHPIDLADPVERAWFEALIWPEHAERRLLAAAAIDRLRRNPPRIVPGDAVEVLEDQLSDAPADCALVVYNSAALCQGGTVEKNAVARILTAFSRRRTIDWLDCENDEVLHRSLATGQATERKLANKDGHGRWLEWL